ncbi:MAG: ATP-binding protein [Burkholderiaceae bacterium]|nr:ATP-binding protein [Burkholderiaceae bacterium]
MTYQASSNILEVLQKIEYEEALPPGDPRFVDTTSARGSQQTFSRLARKFGWDPASKAFFAPNEKHVLFFGHIGSGKTTELRRYAQWLNESNRYYVVEVDVLAKLDRNNLQYTEALMAMAESLLERMVGDRYALNDGDLQPMRDWFAKVTRTRTESRESNAEVKTGMEAGGGLPGLVRLFAKFTAAFKTGSSQKNEWRQDIRNHFTTLAAAFNQFIRSIEGMLKEQGRAERVLFLVDGTDKMRGEDTQQFFVQDAEQLLAIQTLAIYTAPLELKYDGRMGGKLDADIVLPMVKLHERDGSRCEAGWTALTQLLLLRADRSLFSSDEVVASLVEHSGGHPRELLRLLKLCCEFADARIDEAVVRRSIAQLAADYRYFLKPADYELLAGIDSTPEQGGNDEAAQHLLHRLALLQYNDGAWRRSHPVIRTLEGYALAKAALPAKAAPPATA